MTDDVKAAIADAVLAKWREQGRTDYSATETARVAFDAAVEAGMGECDCPYETERELAEVIERERKNHAATQQYLEATEAEVERLRDELGHLRLEHERITDNLRGVIGGARAERDRAERKRYRYREAIEDHRTNLYGQETDGKTVRRANDALWAALDGDR